MVELEQHMTQLNQLHVGQPEQMVPPVERALAAAPNLAYVAFASPNGGGNKGKPEPKPQEPTAAEQARRALQTSMDTRQ